MLKLTTDSRQPVYVGLDYDAITEVRRLLEKREVGTLTLNVLGHVLAAIQAQAAGRALLAGGHGVGLEIPLRRLARWIKEEEVANVEAALQRLTEPLGDLPPPFLELCVEAGDAHVVVAGDYVKPHKFVRTPLPIPRGHQPTAAYYLTIMRRVHYHGARVLPEQVHHADDADKIARRLNRHLSALDRSRLAPYRLVVPKAVTVDKAGLYVRELVFNF